MQPYNPSTQNYISRKEGQEEDKDKGPRLVSTCDKINEKNRQNDPKEAINGQYAGDLGQFGDSSSGSPESFSQKSVTKHTPYDYDYSLTCSPGFREFIYTKYPALEDDESYRRCMHYLLYPSHRSDDTGRIVLPGTRIASFTGNLEKYKSGNLKGENSTGAFLERFRCDVLPDFSWTGYHPTKGRAREISSTGLSKLVYQWRNLDLRDYENSCRVGFVNGKKLTATARTHLRRKQREIAERQSARNSFAEAEEVRTYMNSLPPNPFSRIKRRLEEAQKEADRFANYDQWYSGLIHLRAIADQPQPFYKTVDDSPRLYSCGSSLTTVDKRLRKKLTQGWSEFDLRSAQLAIIAKQWDIPPLRRFLASGESIWDSLYAHMNASCEAKGAIKTALYATVFGMNEDSIYSKLQHAHYREYGYTMPSEVGRHFLTHPLIQTILEARDDQLRHIRDSGGAEDCFGRWIALDEVEKVEGARSVLAQLAQAAELQLLLPAVRLAKKEAKKRPAFRITLWQHDGFSVHFRQKNRRDLWTRRITDVVNQRARELDIPTILEVEHL